MSFLNRPISPSQSTSRPFLTNFLSPLRGHPGDAYQRVDEQEEPDEDADFAVSPSRKGKSKNRNVSWDARGSQMNVLRPNIHAQDKDHESSDDEVPQSFMVEEKARKKSKSTKKARSTAPPLLPSTAADVSTGTPLSIPPRPSELPEEHPALTESHHGAPPMRGLDAYERALWNWVNVANLDAFLQEVYYYYEGKGIYSISLARGLNLLTVGFVIGFSTFLLGCVDFSRIRPDGASRLGDIVIERCVSRFSGFTFLFFVLFTAFYLWRIVAFIFGVRRLVDMYNFYTHLLRIPDADVGTISWPEVVKRIAAIRNENPATAISSKSAQSADASLDAHDIANRIMRQENYLIALFNKEVLDLRVPVPTSLQRFLGPADAESKGKMLTRALEWNLRFCLMEFLFDPQGRVRKVFLKSKNRNILIQSLRRRFIFMGVLNAVFAPFIVLYVLMYSFFRYFEEFHKDSSAIGRRKYTLFAQWKFREFNELPHLFGRRLDESYPSATMYIGQFPNEQLTIIMRFVAFISGSFAAVLVLATVVDPDLFLHFEITPHRTVLFYLSVFGAILAIARGMIPEENRVFDPEMLIEEVIHYTHYMPATWTDKLHSKQVHEEFGQFFEMKIKNFITEIISVVTTPFVLWFSLPNCSTDIVDFFRDFTVFVPGRGYVCSFAEFNFARHGNVKFGVPTRVKDHRQVSKEGKMEKSFLNFKAANPDWTPADAAGSAYLSRIATISRRNLVPSPYPHIGRDRDLHFHGQANISGRQITAADDYEKALKQSQTLARRRQSGLASTVLGSALSAQHGLGASSIWAGGASLAQTAVLGDSAGSIPPPTTTAQARAPSPLPLVIDEDGYIDGKTSKADDDIDPQDMYVDEDETEDGGVLGLLAQIYGQTGKGGTGPVRGI